MSRMSYALWPLDEVQSLDEALTACAQADLLASSPLYAIVEDDHDLCFDTVVHDSHWRLEHDDARPLHAWTQGRVFGALGEVRWQQRERWLHAVLITDRADSLPPGFAEPQDLPLGCDAPHLAWGEWAHNAWREGQLPDELDYPLSPASGSAHAWIEVREYRDDQEQVIATRYAGLRLDKKE